MKHPFAVLTLVALFAGLGGGTLRASSLQPLDLGAACGFAVLAGPNSGAAFTNTGNTTITGAIGAPTESLGPDVTIYGANDLDDASTVAAQASANQAYGTGMNETANPTADELGGVTLGGGVYTSDPSGFDVTGTLTLDAGGNTSAVFIFQMPGSITTLNTGASSAVTLTNGAQAQNVFWVSTGAATIGAGSTFVGTLIAGTAITIGQASVINGRMLANTTNVTISDGAVITNDFACPAATPTPSPTATGSSTATPNVTATQTCTQSLTPSTSPTATVSTTASGTPTGTSSSTVSGTVTGTPTLTPSPTETSVESVTASPSVSATSTSSPTATGSSTGTPFETPTVTPTVTVTLTPPAGLTPGQTPVSPQPINLGEAQGFSILAVSLSNNPTTSANGNVFYSGTGTGPPNPSPCTVLQPGVTGFQAQSDLQTAWNAGMAAPATATLPQELDGLTLLPGVYVSSSTKFDLSNAGSNASLTLDGGGNANAVFIFQATFNGTGLNTTSPGYGAQVILINGAQAQNVFWVVVTATLGNTPVASSFVGTILATTITLDNVSLNGRALAIGTETMSGINSINTPLSVPCGTTATPTPNAQGTGTSTPTGTATATPSPSASATASASPSPSPSSSASVTASMSRTASPSPSASVTASVSPTVSPSASVSPTGSVSPTVSPSPTASLTPSHSPTVTGTSTGTPIVSPTASPSVTSTLTRSPTFTPVYSPTITPLVTTATQVSGQGSYIYPSPARGNQATISYYLRDGGQVTLSIYNQTGRLVDTISESKPSGRQSSMVSVGRFAQGTYYYVVSLLSSEGTTEIQSPGKFVVLH